MVAESLAQFLKIRVPRHDFTADTRRIFERIESSTAISFTSRRIRERSSQKSRRIGMLGPDQQILSAGCPTRTYPAGFHDAFDRLDGDLESECRARMTDAVIFLYAARRSSSQKHRSQCHATSTGSIPPLKIAARKPPRPFKDCSVPRAKSWSIQ